MPRAPPDARPAAPVRGALVRGALVRGALVRGALVEVDAARGAPDRADAARLEAPFVEPLAVPFVLRGATPRFCDAAPPPP
ncbi:hypothetical protein GCM10009809_30450 [Isoptericola hypogeus]|uniref:Uncharacterized protein n=1 Tax=Isoptericola hypogeus TaxID=300179 RepID=A0ABN2JMU1_9MICO